MPELVHVTRGIWRPSESVADLAGRCAALLNAVPPGTVVAGLAAARLHGLWLPDVCVEPIELILRREVAVPREISHSVRAEIRGRRRRLAPDEWTIVDGIPLTSEARTWLDLCERLSLPDLIAAGDSALRGDATMDELRDLLARARHRRGVVRARAALPLLDPRSRSRPESHMRYAVISGGLPAPRVNLPIFDQLGQWLAEPDLSYEEARLALEYNGRQHARVKRMRRDITRDVDVSLRGGWRSVTFGPAEVFGRPAQMACYIRELYRERCASLASKRRVLS